MIYDCELKQSLKSNTRPGSLICRAGAVLYNDHNMGTQNTN